MIYLKILNRFGFCKVCFIRSIEPQDFKIWKGKYKFTGHGIRVEGNTYFL